MALETFIPTVILFICKSCRVIKSLSLPGVGVGYSGLPEQRVRSCWAPAV